MQEAAPFQCGQASRRGSALRCVKSRLARNQVDADFHRAGGVSRAAVAKRLWPWSRRNRVVGVGRRGPRRGRRGGSAPRRRSSLGQLRCAANGGGIAPRLHCGHMCIWRRSSSLFARQLFCCWQTGSWSTVTRPVFVDLLKIRSMRSLTIPSTPACKASKAPSSPFLVSYMTLAPRAGFFFLPETLKGQERVPLKHFTEQPLLPHTHNSRARQRCDSFIPKRPMAEPEKREGSIPAAWTTRADLLLDADGGRSLRGLTGKPLDPRGQAPAEIHGQELPASRRLRQRRRAGRRGRAAPPRHS